jgi:hypothetical protein
MWAEFIEQNLRSNCMLHSLENKGKMLPASPAFSLSLLSTFSVASAFFCPLQSGRTIPLRERQLQIK